MLYTKQALGVESPLSLLESLPTIPREDISYTVDAVPLKEMENFKDVYFSRYTDICQLAEEHDIGVVDAAKLIREAHMLPSSKFVVAIEEWVPMVDSSVVNAFDNVVLTKQPANSIPNQLCEALLTPFVETGDETYLNLYLESLNDPNFAVRILNEKTRYAKEMEKKAAANGTPAPANQFGNMGNNALDARAQELTQKRDQANQWAASDSLNNKSRRSYTNQAVNYDKELMAIENEKKAREAKQQQRAANKPVQQQQAARTNAQGKLSQEEIDQKKQQMKSAAYDRQQQATQPNPNQQNQQGWWARNWSAFKNWMGNLGTNQSTAPNWLNTAVNKVKGWFNGQAAQQPQQPAPAAAAQTNAAPNPAPQQQPAANNGNAAAPAPAPTSNGTPQGQAAPTPQTGGNNNMVNDVVNKALGWLQSKGLPINNQTQQQVVNLANQYSNQATNGALQYVLQALMPNQQY